MATGPGSFTGLRIGVTTAKALAYAIGCQVIGVHTMQAIAARVPTDVERFSVVVDAQRGELFVADFQRTANGEPVGCDTIRTLPADRWIAQREPSTWITGPGLEKWSARLPAGVHTVSPELWVPTAAAVGEVGERAFAAGERIDVFALTPRYFRRTAAEEQWDRKDAANASPR